MNTRLLTQAVYRKFGPKAQMTYLYYLRRPESTVEVTGLATISGEILLDGVTVIPIDETTATLILDRSLLGALAEVENLVHFEIEGRLVP